MTPKQLLVIHLTVLGLAQGQTTIRTSTTTTSRAPTPPTTTQPSTAEPFVDKGLVLFVAGGTDTDDYFDGFRTAEAIHLATSEGIYVCEDPTDLPSKGYQCPPSFKVYCTNGLQCLAIDSQWYVTLST